MSSNSLLFAANLLAIVLVATLLGLAVATTFGRRLKRETQDHITIATSIMSSMAASDMELSADLGNRLALLKTSAIRTGVISSAKNFSGESRQRMLRHPIISFHVEKGIGELGSRFWWRRLSAIRFLQSIIDASDTMSIPTEDSHELVRYLATRWVSKVNVTNLESGTEKIFVNNTGTLQQPGKLPRIISEIVVPNEISHGKSIKKQVRLLDHVNWDTRHAAALALADLGSPGLLALKMASRRSGVDGRKMAIHVIEKRSLGTGRNSRAA